MTRQFFPGAWYIDATPSGSFVALVPQSHLQTHLGRVELPPGEPWGVGFVRCTDVGGFRFAGQAHSTLEPACWEWSAGGWGAYSQPCIGVSPCIYDFRGALVRSDGSVGSQGYRYVAPNGGAGRLVSGDETYRLFNGLLYEYSAAGDLLIGQGATDGSGVRVWDGTVLRQLELGDGRFVRVQVDGERVSVAFMTSAGAVLRQTTMAELRALPPVVDTPPPPKPPDHPKPPVPPVEPPAPPKRPPVDPPTPPEPPQKEPVMLAYGQPLPGFAPSDVVDNGNGTISLKKPNGKFVAVTPDGAVEERDTPGGVWESFIRGKNGLIALREKNGHAVVYVLPVVEA